MPQYVAGSYSDSAVKNAYPPPVNPGDSGYYPIYTLTLKNVGSEADSFRLQFSRNNDLFYITEFVPPGQTAVFRTPGPLKDTATLNPWNFYGGFFVSTTDSIHISLMQPSVSVLYGAIDNGPEGCNSDPLQMQIDVNALH